MCAIMHDYRYRFYQGADILADILFQRPRRENFIDDAPIRNYPLHHWSIDPRVVSVARKQIYSSYHAISRYYQTAGQCRSVDFTLFFHLPRSFSRVRNPRSIVKDPFDDPTRCGHVPLKRKKISPALARRQAILSGVVETWNNIMKKDNVNPAIQND